MTYKNAKTAIDNALTGIVLPIPEGSPQGTTAEQVIKQVIWSKKAIPGSFPCAIIFLEGEKGNLASNAGFGRTSYKFGLHIVVKEELAADSKFDNFEEEATDIVGKVKKALPLFQFKALDEVEYYSSRVELSTEVLVAKMTAESK